MALKEEKVFIKDPHPGMSTRDKNADLAARLALAPLVNLQIVLIERIEIGASGWWIHHRTGRA